MKTEVKEPLVASKEAMEGNKEGALEEGLKATEVKPLSLAFKNSSR